MTRLITIILFFILFLIVLRLARLLSRYWFSSRNKFKSTNERGDKSSQQFKDVEEAEFREIPPDKKESE